MRTFQKWFCRQAVKGFLLAACVLPAAGGTGAGEVPPAPPAQHRLAVENPGPGKANDLLKLPALRSNLAASSLLLDVTRAGTRLVAVGERGHIVYSDDDGESWMQAEVPVSVTLTAVTFPTPELGWAVGHDSVVLHTSDAGRSWRLQADSSEFNTRMVEAVKRIIEKRRVALEHAPDELRDEEALELEAAEFFLSDVEAAVEEGASHPFMDVWFDNELEGLVFGAFGMIFRTGDGGKTWTTIADHIEYAEGFHYYAAGEMADGALIAVGEAGTLIRSSDRGRTWQKLESPYAGSLFGLVADRRFSCAVGVGLRGNAIRVCDEGAVVGACPSLGEGALTGGTVLPDGTMVVVGMAPVIHISRDNGRTFRNISTPFPGCMAVAYTGEGELLLAGMGGIYKMTLNEADDQ